MRAFLASSVGVALSAVLILPVSAGIAPDQADRPAARTQRAELPGHTQSLSLAAALSWAGDRADPGVDTRPSPRAADRTGDRAADRAGSATDRGVGDPGQAGDAGAAGGRLDRAAPAGAGGPRVLTARHVRPFSMVGAVWNDPDTDFDGQVQVRVHRPHGTAWSGWQDLQMHDDDTPDRGSAEGSGPAAHGGSAPLWVGDSDAVQARVLPAGGSHALPPGLRLELIDPGRGPVAHRAVPRPVPRARTQAAVGGGDVPGTGGWNGWDDWSGLTNLFDHWPNWLNWSPYGHSGQSSHPAGQARPHAHGKQPAKRKQPKRPHAVPHRPAAAVPHQAHQPATGQGATTLGTGAAHPGGHPQKHPTGAQHATHAKKHPKKHPKHPKKHSKHAKKHPKKHAKHTGPAGHAGSPYGYAAPEPPIVSRAGWKADEGLRRGGHVYTKTVKTVFVHHTATGNAYRCAQAPAVIRGIYRYHVRSLGWRDIGYNFLIDKCGTIYEGRAGGVAKPVLGAHTLGFNTNSTGVAVIGTFTKTAPSSAAVRSVERLAAWKLGLYHRSPMASSPRESLGSNKYRRGARVSMHRISGHRDGFVTECPGTRLYDELGAIRRAAARMQGR